MKDKDFGILRCRAAKVGRTSALRNEAEIPTAPDIPLYPSTYISRLQRVLYLPPLEEGIFLVSCLKLQIEVRSAIRDPAVKTFDSKYRMRGCRVPLRITPLLNV
jgi:hypothetical protein